MATLRKPWMYCAAGLLLFSEMAIFAAALYPDVSPDYRAYYIDRSTECYPLPVSGAYRLGERVQFGAVPGSKRANLARCGWRDAEALGSWSDGERSMLRFAVAPQPADLTLELDARPYLDSSISRQRIEVSANGSPVETLELTEQEPTTHRIVIPSAIVGTTGWLDLTFAYPDRRPVAGTAGSGVRYYALFLHDLTLSRPD